MSAGLWRRNRAPTVVGVRVTCALGSKVIIWTTLFLLFLALGQLISLVISTRMFTSAFYLYNTQPRNSDVRVELGRTSFEPCFPSTITSFDPNADHFIIIV